MLVPAPCIFGRIKAADNQNQEIHDRIAAIYWNRIGGEKDDTKFDLSMATIFFVKTRTGCFGITNCHVYDGYNNATKDGWFRMETYINSVPVELDYKHISHDDYLDLATFRFDEQEIKSFGVKLFDYSRGEWAIQEIIQSDEIAFSGFPLGRRYIEGQDDGQEQLQVYVDKLVKIGKVNTLSKDKISTVWEWDDRRISAGNRFYTNTTPLPQVFDCGGFSGGPLMFRSKKRHIADGWELGGVIFEGQPLSDIGPDLFYATPIRFINESGMIERDFF